jgi:hypothetical protein
MDLNNKKELIDVLESTRRLIVSQGRIVDDRLLRREENLERILSSLETIEAREMLGLSLHYVRKPAAITKNKEF